MDATRLVLMILLDLGQQVFFLLTVSGVTVKETSGGPWYTVSNVEILSKFSFVKTLVN